MPKKKSNKLYQYLEASGVLATGDDALIRAKKVEFYREYKRQWKRKRRAEQSYYHIYFTDDELQVLTSAAKKHKVSVTRMIKRAAIAYIQQVFIVPDRAVLYDMREALMNNYNALQRLFDDNLLPYEAGKEALDRMTALEREVLNCLLRPKRAQ